MPLSHPLKGKPAASAWRRLRQPPCLRFRPLLARRRQQANLWLWLGRLSPVAGRSSRPRTKAVMESDSHQADSRAFRLWITRIMGVSTYPRSHGGAPDSPACSLRAARIKEAPINAPLKGFAGMDGNNIAHRADFSYSDPLKNHGGRWDWDTMSAWLHSPRSFAPGTKMTFAGLSDPQERADVMLFLNQHGGTLTIPPPPAEAAPAAGNATEANAAAADANAAP